MLTFYLYNPEDDCDDFLPESAMTIQEYLNNPPSWEPQLENTILIFKGLSMELNEDINNFGILSHILPQLEEVGKRLSEGTFAVLKTSNFGESLFFIFEPKENTTYFSSLGTLPSPYSTYYPLSNSPMFFSDGRNQQQELYNFISSHTNDTISDERFPDIKNIEFNTLQLIASLNEQVRLGNELLEFLRS